MGRSLGHIFRAFFQDVWKHFPYLKWKHNLVGSIKRENPQIMYDFEQDLLLKMASSCRL